MKKAKHFKKMGTSSNMKKSKNITKSDEVRAANELKVKVLSELDSVTPNHVPLKEQLKQELFHERLLEALYWIWDAMERGNMNFFVIGDTADSVINNKDLSGTKITVGVRRLEWNSGAKRIVDAFATPLTETDDKVTYEYEGVPVELYLFDDDPSITSPNQIIYHSEYFKFPNPYSKFQEVFQWK